MSPNTFEHTVARVLRKLYNRALNPRDRALIPFVTSTGIAKETIVKLFYGDTWKQNGKRRTYARATTNNNFADGTVLVSFVGDVNGDRKVRVDDVLAVAQRFGTNYGGPPNSNGYYYDSNCDINDDLKIRIDDVLAAAQNYGQGP